MGYMIGVDVGGTFTDFSIFDTVGKKLFHFKHSSTPEDPSRAIVNGILHILESEGISPEEVEYLAHGTTVATNALIEKKGARLGLITTKGFKDLIEIGNQKRPSLYDLLKDKPASIIPSGMKCEVEERILHDGSVKTPLKEQDVLDAIDFFKKQGVSTIAVCTLFSFINPAHEKRIKDIINKVYPEAYVSISSELVSEFREYSRMSTTVLNAYLGPVMKHYVNNFEKCVKEAGIEVNPYVTQSNGSIISISETVECPIKTAVSGPSAGVIGATYTGRQCGIDKIITFDMGGTSIDVSLIENGKASISYERMVEGYPARIPMIDIVTVGAGGGSIAAIDEGGALKVGPRSAGAVPGPACYKRGGKNPTVTDANIVLGKLNQKKILGGRMDVDLELAKEALKEQICGKSSLSLEDAAAGVISVVNSNMVRAVRIVSVERGFDVREFTLMAFGGAGPLHACEVSEELGIRQVLFPPSPGTLCSLGLLMADTRFDLSRSNIMIACESNIAAIDKIFKELQQEGDRLLTNESISDRDKSYVYTIDCRYERQNYEIAIEVPASEFNAEALNGLIDSFNQEHNRSYGYCDPGKKVQLVNYRVSAIGSITKPDIDEYPIGKNLDLPEPSEVRRVRFEGYNDFVETKVYQRNEIPIGAVIPGPAIIEQMDSTSVIPPRWAAYHDKYANLIVRYQEVE
ncbi:MAG: hydantoinase/oxoprolinase family protein [Clostridiaceae bacterium]|nr:hydantoinase/oxoprolinase family protein [Clostridiaceae bacterium]